MTPTPSPTSEAIYALLKLPAVEEHREEIAELLREHERAVKAPLEFQRNAGRALAEEGLETLEVTEQTRAWVERLRQELLQKLKGVLGIEEGKEAP